MASMAGTVSAVPISVPGCPCRGLGCCCQRFRPAGESAFCGACSHHLAFHQEPVATSLQCKWRQLKRGPPPESEIVIGDDGKVVVLWSCGCSDFIAKDGGNPNCAACSHDECFHAASIPNPSSTAPYPQPMAPPPVAAPQVVHVSSGGVTPIVLAPDVNVQLLAYSHGTSVVSQVVAGPGAQAECVVQVGKKGKSKAPLPSGPEPILASWHEGVQGITPKILSLVPDL